MNMQHPSKWKDPNLDKAEAQDEVLGWFSCNSFLAGGGFHHVERETQIQELLEDGGPVTFIKSRPPKFSLVLLSLLYAKVLA